MKDKQTKSDFSKKEFKRILKPLLDHFMQEYSISKQDFSDLILEKDEILVPLSIFSLGLAPLQSLVKYLKQNLRLKNKEISSLISRDSKVVWNSYNQANKKHPSIISVKKSLPNIPLAYFQNKEQTIFESLVCYMKEDLKLAVKQISQNLNKKPSTIYTVYNRVKNKIKNG